METRPRRRGVLHSTPDYLLRRNTSWDAVIGAVEKIARSAVNLEKERSQEALNFRRRSHLERSVQIEPTVFTKLAPVRARKPKFKPMTVVPSLRSLCLDLIGDNIDKYDTESFSTVEPEIVKRVSRFVHHSRKDKTCFGLWWLTATSVKEQLGPEEAVRTQLVYPEELLHHLNDPGYALRELYRTPMPHFDLLTTLHLQSRHLTDASCISLRHLSNLTFLFTPESGLTDLGILQMASGLEVGCKPEDRKGMWRLRGWWLDGSPKISEHSLRTFLRWPLLHVLSLDNTAIRPSAILSTCDSSSARPRWQTGTDNHLQLLLPQIRKRPTVRPRAIMHAYDLIWSLESLVPASRRPKSDRIRLCWLHVDSLDVGRMPEADSEGLVEKEKETGVYVDAGVGRIYGQDLGQKEEKLSLLDYLDREPPNRRGRGRGGRRRDNPRTNPYLQQILAQLQGYPDPDQRSREFVTGGPQRRVQARETDEVVYSRKGLGMMLVREPPDEDGLSEVKPVVVAKRAGEGEGDAARAVKRGPFQAKVRIDTSSLSFLGIGSAVPSQPARYPLGMPSPKPGGRPQSQTAPSNPFEFRTLSKAPSQASQSSIQGTSASESTVVKKKSDLAMFRKVKN